MSGRYAICFDFPETPGEPWFAAFVGDAPGLTTNLQEAERFAKEDDADRFLTTAYGPSVNECGTVVEVAG